MSLGRLSRTGTWNHPTKQKIKKDELFECSDRDAVAVAERAADSYVEETFGEDAEKLQEFFTINDIKTAVMSGFYAAKHIYDEDGELELEIDEDDLGSLRSLYDNLVMG